MAWYVPGCAWYTRGVNLAYNRIEPGWCMYVLGIYKFRKSELESTVLSGEWRICPGLLVCPRLFVEHCMMHTCWCQMSSSSQLAAPVFEECALAKQVYLFCTV